MHADRTTPPARIHAEISLAGPNAVPLGAERIRLLEAIGAEGGISAAARALGLSYRGAWDALRAMNTLVGRPLVVGQTGGPGGGGASLTPEGRRLVASFHRLQAELSRVFQEIAPEFAGTEAAAPGADAAARPKPSGFPRTSARNALRGTVAEAREGPVNAEVRLSIGDGRALRVTLTARSLRELGLAPGRPAIALIKAPLIGILPAGAPPLSPALANDIAGTVAAVERDATSTEVILDIGGGMTLCAIVPAAADAAFALAPGDAARALIDPAHVILAVE